MSWAPIHRIEVAAGLEDVAALGVAGAGELQEIVVPTLHLQAAVHRQVVPKASVPSVSCAVVGMKPLLPIHAVAVEGQQVVQVVRIHAIRGAALPAEDADAVQVPVPGRRDFRQDGV